MDPMIAYPAGGAKPPRSTRERARARSDPSWRSIRALLEHDGLVAARLVAAGDADGTRASVAVDMDFDISYGRSAFPMCA